MVNTSIGMVAVAKQAARDTAASTPTFLHGLTGGQTFQLDRSVEDAAVACGVRAGTDAYVSTIVPGLDFETYGYSDALPLYFYGAMGNIASTGSESAGYDHVITLGDMLPYLTFWGRTGSEYTQVSGAKINELEMSFEGNQPLEFGVTVIGMAATLGLASIPGSIDPACFDGYFVPTNGTFKVDTAGDAPAVAPVMSGSLTLNNNCTYDPYAGQVMPGDVAEGKLTTSGSITVKPDDMALYRKMVTGSDSGTTPTGAIVYGSFELNFTHSKNPEHTLKIAASRVPFTAEFPEVDPNGGAAEVEFSFADLYLDSPSGSPLTVTVHNGTASY